MRLSSTRSNINKDQSKFMHFSADINLHLQAIFQWTYYKLDVVLSGLQWNLSK